MVNPKKFSSWKVVILSFVGATTFWFFSALGKDYSYRIKYPIEFVFDSDSLVAVKPLPEFVDIDVSGGGWDLFKQTFWFGGDVVQFELDNPAAIRYLTRPTILPIITEQLNAFRINFLFTDTLFIDIDRKSFKKVYLKIDSTKIDMEPDYRIISNIQLTPDTALIYGPTSFLDSLKPVHFVPIDVDELDKDFDRFIKLGLPEVFDIHSDPPTINVKFDVERYERLTLSTKVELLNFPDDSSVFVANPNVTLQFVVQESLEETFFPDDFKVVVDFSMINRMDSTAPAMVVFQPDHALEVEVIPDSLVISYVQKP